MKKRKKFLEVLNVDSETEYEENDGNKSGRGSRMNINQLLEAPEETQMNAKAVGKLRVWQGRNKMKVNTIAKLCQQLENDLGRDLS